MCAQTNFDFNRMEIDLYNLWPIDGELNGLRSNYSMAQISVDEQSEVVVKAPLVKTKERKSQLITFGGCKAKVDGRKFEPMHEFKGIVARDYMYMDQTYPGHGIISGKNGKLFEAWDKEHPAGDWECRRAEKIKALQQNENEVLKSRYALFFKGSGR